MTEEERFMGIALEEARRALAEGNRPFGAAVDAGDLKVVPTLGCLPATQIIIRGESGRQYDTGA